MKKIIFLLVLTLTTTSCESFLEEEPRAEQSLDQYFQSEQEAQGFVNALYHRGAAEFYNSGDFTGSIVMMGGYASGFFDNEAKGERIGPIYAQELSYNGTNMASYLYTWWANAYNAIATANTVIQRVPTMEGISQATANQLVGQARFFRAFNYLFLVRSFGDVPLVTEPYTSLENVYAQRTPSTDVYRVIVEDLTWAYEQGGLPDGPFAANGFRITMGAVATLLADAELQMAGYPLQAADHYARAAAAARNVIHSGAYHLIPNGATAETSAYNTMRTSDAEGEYIYSIEYLGGIANNNQSTYALPGDVRPTGLKYTRTFNAYRPLDEFIALYDQAKDLRIQNRQLFYTSFSRNGETYDLGEYVPYLYFDEKALFETAKGDMDIRVFRYAEVLLIAAEAIARSEGVTGEAVGYLADVRGRAYWQTDRAAIVASLSGLSVDQFVEEVWKERYRELALDYKVWSDIQRTRKYPLGSGNGEVTFVNVVGQRNHWGVTYQEHHLLWPISITEMQRNPSLTQNPGY